MYYWKRGLSLSFFRNKEGTCTGGEPEMLRKAAEAGIQCVELSFSYDEYFGKYHLTEGDTAEKLFRLCRGLGLEIWSIHLPFSDVWDLSRENADDVLADFVRLIEAASRAQIKVAVLHPSFEPVGEVEREHRLKVAENNIRILNREAEKAGVILALENLPRTCLGNTSEEMIRLLRETGTEFIFDTNHSLGENNITFLSEMVRAGYCPVSLHISDYDFIDERHLLPGCGKNDWKRLLEMLAEAGYRGPALYEVSDRDLSGNVVTLQDVQQNIGWLLQGKIG